MGEEQNKLLGYLAAVSRKLEEPLAVIIQSSSAAGKTSLMEAILAFMPEEERVKYSAMTGQSLFYMGETDLKHKILAIVEEQGAERASYALKLLQSEGELTIASTGKDPQTGRLVTHEYRVCGPVMIFLTTTAVEIDDELLNRCLVLTVDEDREQTRAIHRLQREKQTLEGLLARQGAQAGPAEGAPGRAAPAQADPRRQPLRAAPDFHGRPHAHAARPRKVPDPHRRHRPAAPVPAPPGAWSTRSAVPYIDVTLDDIAVANRLAHQVLGRSLDELAPQTRRLLEVIKAVVRERCEAQKMERAEYRFTPQGGARARWAGATTQMRVHLERLGELEYVLDAPRRAGPELRVRAAVRLPGPGRTALPDRPDRRRALRGGSVRRPNYDDAALPGERAAGVSASSGPPTFRPLVRG